MTRGQWFVAQWRCAQLPVGAGLREAEGKEEGEDLRAEKEEEVTAVPPLRNGLWFPLLFR